MGLFESFAKGLTAAVTNAGGGGRDQGMSNEARATIAAPFGPDNHANADGYAVIARAFAVELGL